MKRSGSKYSVVFLLDFLPPFFFPFFRISCGKSRWSSLILFFAVNQSTRIAPLRLNRTSNEDIQSEMYCSSRTDVKNAQAVNNNA